MILQQKRKRFQVPWKSLGTRCVRDPACCANPVPVCGGCGWTMPDIIYMAFHGSGTIPWNVAPGVTVPNDFVLDYVDVGTNLTAYPGDLRFFSTDGSALIGNYWALGDINLSPNGETTWYPGYPGPFVIGPRPNHAIYLYTDTNLSGCIYDYYLTILLRQFCPTLLGGPHAGESLGIQFQIMAGITEVPRNPSFPCIIWPGGAAVFPAIGFGGYGLASIGPRGMNLSPTFPEPFSCIPDFTPIPVLDHEFLINKFMDLTS